MAATAQNPQFKSGTAAVRVDALVTDGGRPVRGLTAASFELRDNGVRQTITDVHHEALPLNVICALDVSNSVAGEPLEDLKRAYLALIDALSKDDRAALLTFANRIALHSPLTGDRARLRALVGKVAAGGTTSLFDALFSALALRETDEGRTLLILLSDGRDTSSWLTARKVVAAARRTDVVVYPITTQAATPRLNFNNRRAPRSQRPESSERFLEALADETGGRVFYETDESALAATFLKVLDEFRQRYVLTYTATGVAEGGWHTIEVKLRGRSGEVRARRGYFAN
jgi:Ca-activated chloride channel family protein